MDRQQPLRRPDPVQRLRLRYAKAAVMRFASHRDIARALERALRRADIPVAYSSGFSPHPRLSYANPAPTGAASYAEYAVLGLAERREPDEVRDLLTAALPAGLPVTCVRETAGEKLADLVTASLWRVDLGAVDAARLAAACEQLLHGADEIIVRRASGRGERVLDVRASLAGLEPDGAGLRVLLAHATPSVRPDDVLAALVQVDAGLACDDPRFTRWAQGRLDGEKGASTALVCAGAVLMLPPGEDDPTLTQR
ncbi:MAG: TIGR03936 family radical SAM-associated protein [Propionibacteriaceae bacterium]|nr:TIGR03936 family radical SAM-associated protein [Propionibacteriaceae bacterium]